MKVLLAAHTIKVKRRKVEEQLSNFGGGEDFLKLFHDFAYRSITKPRHQEKGKKNKIIYSLTCPSGVLPNLNEDAREAYGYFDAGRNGDEFKVKNFQNEKSKYRQITKRHTSLRECFYYIHIPKGRKKGYLILQVPEGQGIKSILEHFLNEYRKEKRLNVYTFEINSVINEKVFYKMLEQGSLKEMNFIKHGIPNKIDKLNGKDEKIPIAKGSIKTTYQSTKFDKDYIDLARGLWDKIKPAGLTNDMDIPKKIDEKIVVEFLDGDVNEYDEISMMVEVDGKQKTFQMTPTNKKVLPDVDVTNNVGTDKRGKLLTADLITQAKELINDVSNDINTDDVKI